MLRTEGLLAAAVLASESFDPIFFMCFSPDKKARIARVRREIRGRGQRTTFGTCISTVAWHTGSCLRAKEGISFAQELLLKRPALTVDEIGAKTSFQFHPLATVFKGQLGCSPTAFRRLHPHWG
jgi:AraC-like DNA-binding protein